MIGILAKLARAAQLAKQAEAAIDVASNLGRKESPRVGVSESGEVRAELSRPPAPVERELPVDYRAMLETGLPDVQLLLPLDRAEAILGKPIRRQLLAGTGDCVVCDYHCKDRAGTVLGIHLSKTMAWEGFESEIEKMEVYEELGDAAFRGGRQLYVKVGSIVFWVHTAGEVRVAMALEAARRVVVGLRALEAEPER